MGQGVRRAERVDGGAGTACLEGKAMKSILLHVGEDAHFESRLQAALDLARLMNGHLECLQTRRIPPFLGNDTGGFAGGAAMIAGLMADDAQQALAERTALSARLDGEGVPYDWSEAMGEASQTLVDRSLLSDCIVMSLPDGKATDMARLLSEVVTKADAPVLAVPAGLVRLPLEKPILLAWKPVPEAAHAVKRAIPLLERASRVDILTIDPTGTGDLPPLKLAAYLSRHGIKAELHERHSGGSQTADVLQKTAQELDSGLIVMGGYGRSRAMEFLLGGVTRHLLGTSEISLLMAH
jgi:nucleotide-binding universal stress UspA family protein